MGAWYLIRIKVEKSCVFFGGFLYNYSMKTKTKKDVKEVKDVVAVAEIVENCELCRSTSPLVKAKVSIFGTDSTTGITGWEEIEISICNDCLVSEELTELPEIKEDKAT